MKLKKIIMISIICLLLSTLVINAHGQTKWSEYVSMFDGTKLAVDIYLPTEGTGPFPVLFNYLPYKRAIVNLQTGKITVLYAPDHEKMVQTFISNGYAVAIADMRGSGASYGSKIDMSPQLARDGKELIDWIEAQPWCNGNVGMYGGSYHGWSQFAVAGQNPRALKCIMPEVMAFDMFSGGFFYYNGIYNKVAMDFIWPTIGLLDLDAYIPGHPRVTPVAPVIDEDGDGNLIDEIPLYNSGTPPLFFIYGPPTYSNGDHTKNIYYNAISEHLNNINGLTWVPNASYRDSNIAGLGYTYTDIGPSDWPVHMSESGIAIYNVGGWFDIFTLGTTQWYATMKATNPSKMFIHPSFHGVLNMSACSALGPYWGYFGVDCTPVADGFLQERVGFFDRYLKGIRNGIDNKPPVRIYVMNGDGWRFEDEWPLARQVINNYYFGAGNTLSLSGTTVGSDDYRVDFTHSSRYGTNNMGRYLPGLSPDKVMIRTSKDQQCLSYTSEPLDQDAEVTGHPIVRLWVSSTADNGDFFMYLEDVDENGEAYYVTEGQLRAGFAGTVPAENILPPDAGIDVKPDLPYHGYKQSDYVDKIFGGGNKVELAFDLLPTSWIFKKGHRIRVSIAGADWPNFQIDPKLSPTNNPSDPNNIIPTITVYHDVQHPSRIELPVIPPKPTLFVGSAKVKTTNGNYEGTAQLYAFQGAVYLNYGDKWIKWETVKYKEGKKKEVLDCNGDFGKLNVSIVQKKDGSSVARGQGKKVSFMGTANK